MNLMFRSLIALACVLGLAGPALAQRPCPEPGHGFFDLGGDGPTEKLPAVPGPGPASPSGVGVESESGGNTPGYVALAIGTLGLVWLIRRGRARKPAADSAPEPAPSPVVLVQYRREEPYRQDAPRLLR